MKTLTFCNVREDRWAGPFYEIMGTKYGKVKFSGPKGLTEFTKDYIRRTDDLIKGEFHSCEHPFYGYDSETEFDNYAFVEISKAVKEHNEDVRADRRRKFNFLLRQSRMIDRWREVLHDAEKSYWSSDKPRTKKSWRNLAWIIVLNTHAIDDTIDELNKWGLGKWNAEECLSDPEWVEERINY